MKAACLFIADPPHHGSCKDDVVPEREVPKKGLAPLCHIVLLTHPMDATHRAGFAHQPHRRVHQPATLG